MIYSNKTYKLKNKQIQLLLFPYIITYIFLFIIPLCFFISGRIRKHTVVASMDFRLIVQPLLVIYAFFGLREISRILLAGKLLHSAGLVFAAGLLFVNQLSFTELSRPVMDANAAEIEQITLIGSWIATSVPSGSTLSADKPDVVGYFASRPVGTLAAGIFPETDYVVSTRPEIDGFIVVFKPMGELTPGPGAPTGNHAVWKKQ